MEIKVQISVRSETGEPEVIEQVARLCRCPCESSELKSFRPLAERLPERTPPELVYLETKFASLVLTG